MYTNSVNNNSNKLNYFNEIGNDFLNNDPIQEIIDSLKRAEPVDRVFKAAEKLFDHGFEISLNYNCIWNVKCNLSSNLIAKLNYYFIDQKGFPDDEGFYTQPQHQSYPESCPEAYSQPKMIHSQYSPMISTNRLLTPNNQYFLTPAVYSPPLLPQVFPQVVYSPQERFSGASLNSSGYAKYPSSSPLNKNSQNRKSQNSSHRSKTSTPSPKSPLNSLKTRSPNGVNITNDQEEIVSIETYIESNFPRNINELSDFVKFSVDFTNYLKRNSENKKLKCINLDKNFKKLFNSLIEANKPEFIKIILELFVPGSRHWQVDADFFVTLSDIYLSEGKIDKSLEIVENRIYQEKLKINSMVEISIQIRWLDMINTPKTNITDRQSKLRAFHEYVTKIKNEAITEGRWKIPFIEGKYHYLAGDQTNFNASLNEIEQLINEKSDDIGNIIEQLKSFFLVTGCEQIFSKATELWKHSNALKRDCKTLLKCSFFDEYLQKDTSDIDLFYHSCITENPSHREIKHNVCNHIYFLARRGEYQLLEQRLSNYLVQFPENFLIKKIEIQNLITSDCENDSFDKINELLIDQPKFGEVHALKATLHLNPLSKFYDIDLAENALEEAILSTPQYCDSYILKYGISLIKGQSNEANLDTIFSFSTHGKFGFIWDSFIHDPNHFIKDDLASLKATIRAFFNQMESVYRGDSHEERLERARALRPELDDSQLYLLFSGPCGMNLHSLANAMSDQTPSKRLHTIFR